MKNIFLVVMFLVLVMYRIIIIKLKSNVVASESEDFDLSVASYKPIIKSGDYRLVLTDLGTEKEATLKTVNRYRNEPLTDIEVGDEATRGLDIYTLEDLLYELKYIGANGEILKNEE